MSNWQAWLYVAAVLVPLGAFVVQFLGLRVLGRLNAYIATAAILTSFGLSASGLASYLIENRDIFLAAEHAPTGHEAEAAHEERAEEAAEHAAPSQTVAWSLSTDWVLLGGDGRELPPLVIPLGVHIDGLAAIMFVMVTFIASLIHIYSMGYMSEDPGYPRFFAFLSLFCFSMLGLVASATIFMVFIFWELVGVCSYLLIGFWYQEKANCDAANKAFIVNRVGDIGMLIGLGILWSALGTFDIGTINRGIRDNHGALNEAMSSEGPVVQLRDRFTNLPQTIAGTGATREVPYWLLTIAGLGIFAGCVGKSAQFPLHVWLPDAMAGPTPVSALIHAATMVAAGVYLVGRFFPVFTPEAQLFIAYTGGITLFIAATIAVVQSDYKKVLAYSTVSQLGFMMLALGVGGWAAGLFHLLTHAFFKALLFLGAGSVYHSVHTYEMPRLGGLLKKMPITGYTMLAATLAISGVPFFSGFYSKDAILAAALQFVQQPDHGQHILLLLLPCVGATITAFYMFRMWFMLFTGTSRSAQAAAAAHDHLEHVHAAHGAADAGHGHAHGHHDDPVAHAHESPPIMSWPLIILAVPSVMIGWPWLIVPVLGGTPVLETLLAAGAPMAITHGETPHALLLGLSILIAATGIGLALGFYYYEIFSAREVAARLAPVYDFLRHKWYFDELYDRVFVRPTLALGRALGAFDRNAIDGLLHGIAESVTEASRLSGAADARGVDGAVNAVGRITYAAGDWGRTLQTGHLRGYLMMLTIGLVLLFAGLFRWAQL